MRWNTINIHDELSHNKNTWWIIVVRKVRIKGSRGTWLWETKLDLMERRRAGSGGQLQEFIVIWICRIYFIEQLNILLMDAFMGNQPGCVYFFSFFHCTFLWMEAFHFLGRGTSLFYFDWGTYKCFICFVYMTNNVGRVRCLFCETGSYGLHMFFLLCWT